MTSMRNSDRWWQNFHAQNSLYLHKVEITKEHLCGVDSVPRSPTIAYALFCVNIVHQRQPNKK